MIWQAPVCTVLQVRLQEFHTQTVFALVGGSGLLFNLFGRTAAISIHYLWIHVWLSAASCFYVATFVSSSMWVKILIYIAHGDIYLTLWARIHQKGEMHPEGIIAQLFLEAH